jgi:two-component system, chemotaxis family, chemotaxis protein CheV
VSEPNQQGILLESGTNELEILVFTLGEQRYGVNVAKVREVIEPVELTKLPESPEAMDGVFQLRNIVTPLINLSRCLHLSGGDDGECKTIIMEFNDVRVGFSVTTVEQIYRVSWKNVTAVPAVDGVQDAPVTSVAHINDHMVLMLDFEQIVFEIGGVDLFEESASRIEKNFERGDQRILLAEDSAVMRKLIQSNVVKSGYTNLVVCTDGQEAWEALEQDVATNGTPTFSLVITDIEMPRMDGLFLTKRLKEHAAMKDLPVIIFSSLVSVDNEKKCKAVGASAQITKPQLAELVELIDRLIIESEVPAAVAV